MDWADPLARAALADRLGVRSRGAVVTDREAARRAHQLAAQAAKPATR